MYEAFNELFKEYRKAKGKDTSKYTKQARELYRKKLYHKLKKNYEDDVELNRYIFNILNISFSNYSNQS